jgi:hypothetical protein
MSIVLIQTDETDEFPALFDISLPASYNGNVCPGLSRGAWLLPEHPET